MLFLNVMHCQVSIKRIAANGQVMRQVLHAVAQPPLLPCVTMRALPGSVGME